MDTTWVVVAFVFLFTGFAFGAVAVASKIGDHIHAAGERR